MSYTFNKAIDAGTGTNSRHGYMNLYRLTGGGVTFTAVSLAGADDLISTAMVVNDGLQFMVPSNGFSPKFSGLQFNIGQAVVAVGLTFAYEYRKSDGTWVAFAGVTDNTVGFTVTGVNTITWTVPTDWGSNATAVNGLTGALWARIRITASGGITTAARKAASQHQYFNYAISVDDNTEFDSGTATSGWTTTITNTGKAYTVDALRYRIISIHTGTGSGQRRIIVSNTATVITIVGYWDTIPDNTSQYSILSNMEDVYLADVAAGWGLVTKNGPNSYFVNCNLEIWLAGFGSVLDTVEFGEAFTYIQRYGSSSSRYIQQFGARLSPEHGADSTILGSTWVTTQNSGIDNRTTGFLQGTYTYLYDSRFINRLMYSYLVLSYIRFWFMNQVKESINNKFEGFRSTQYASTYTESKRDEISFNHSGIEAPLASFVGARTYFNASLNVFITGSATQKFDKSFIGLPINPDVYSGINHYAYTNTFSKIIDPKGARFRPVGDIWSANSNGILNICRTINIMVDDEMGNAVDGARLIVKNASGTVIWDRVSGQTILNALSVTSGNTYTTMTNQPTVPDRLRITFTNYSDTGGASASARMIIKGTDKNGTVIGEQIFLENIGNHTIRTQEEYATVTSLLVKGFSATVAIDRKGSFGTMELTVETWQSTNDSTLTNLVDNNPFTLKFSRGGFEPLVKKIQVLDSENKWIIGLKRSVKVFDI